MSHAVESMAYAGEVPWHGLGKKVNPTLSVDEMLKQAGLDWKVRLVPAYAYDETTAEAIDIHRNALVRSTDNKVLTVTGENWKPLQNADALGFFRDYTKAGGATLETAGSLHGGKVIWGLANLNNKFTIKGGTDAVKGYLLLISPHEVGSSIKGFVTGTRVVCANTLRMAELGAKQGLFSQTHLKEFDSESAKKAIGLAHIQFNEFNADAQKLAKLKLSELDATRFLAKFFQPIPDELKAAVANDTEKRAVNKWVEGLLAEVSSQSKSMSLVLKSLHEAPGAQPGTGWGVFNAVTHYYDHVAGREKDARLFNSWLGDASRTKLKVKDDLLELAA